MERLIKAVPNVTLQVLFEEVIRECEILKSDYAACRKASIDAGADCAV